METLPAAAVAVADSGDSNRSGVSWAAIFAGAAGAAALSYVLLILGFGLGLSSVSPWMNQGAEAKTVGILTIVWLAFTQIAAAGMGGYLAGRLRVKWADVHRDEVYFRDTAHGFLSWAVASLVVVAFLASTVGNVLNGGASVAGSALSGAGSAVGSAVSAAATTADSNDGDSAYFVDSLFRSTGLPPPVVPAADPAAPVQSAPAATPRGDRAEAARILLNGIRTGNLADADKHYLAQVIAQETGIAQPEAEQRVQAGYDNLKASIESAKNTAKQIADDARKAAAHMALWLFVSLLCGAFFASLMATIGGRRRDDDRILARRSIR